MRAQNQPKPTYAQLEAIFRWFTWQMPRNEATAAVNYLKEHASRRQVSQEMGRLYPLYKGHNLTKERCFESEVWEGFAYA